MPVPQVLVTLTPQGELAVELPGSQATRRKVILSVGSVESSLRRILEAQVGDATEIGLDGAPTARQVQHWEKHSEWPRLDCRFCIAEGRADPKPQRVRKTIVEKRPDGVEIRRVAEGQKAKQQAQRSVRSAEELGL